MLHVVCDARKREKIKHTWIEAPRSTAGPDGDWLVRRLRKEREKKERKMMNIIIIIILIYIMCYLPKFPRPQRKFYSPLAQRSQENHKNQLPAAKRLEASTCKPPLPHPNQGLSLRMPSTRI